MYKKIIKMAIISLFLSFSLIAAENEKTNLKYEISENPVLKQEILDNINESVFEVVIKKQSDKGISYEKTLPLEKLPYASRNDEYISIGTAFAISEDKFITAAHVLSLNSESQYKEIFIRDQDKVSFKIDTIIKFSSNKDFVVFKASGKKVKKHLTSSEKYTLNTPVFTVGNALGDGVVIRNGIVTSETFEEDEGLWKWIRFSAPASPGNSGGPLLDMNGDIIGVILKKSANENLNYALPLREITSHAENKALIHTRYVCSLYNYDKNKTSYFDYSSNLPKTVEELKEDIKKSLEIWYDKTMKSLFEENKDDIFPNSNSSLKVLYTSYNTKFPGLISKDRNRDWGLFIPQISGSSELGNNGYIKYGSTNNLNFLYYKKPDNATLKSIYENPKLMLDNILKGFPLYRNFGGENIRITSLGEPTRSSEFKDPYERKWFYYNWSIPYEDTKFVIFALPVPEGFAAIISLVPTNDLSMLDYDLKLMSSFVYLSYGGKFSEWKEYLSQTEYLPEKFKSLEITESEDGITIDSSKAEIKLDKGLFKAGKRNSMLLNCSFYKKESGVDWDIGGILIEESKYNYIFLEKEQKPAEGLTEYFFDEWENLTTGIFPYNRQTYYENYSTMLKDLPKQYKKLENKPGAPFVYTLTLGMAGNVENSVIQDKFDKYEKNIFIKE